MLRFYSTNIANFASSLRVKNTNKNPRQTQHLTTSAATAWRIQPIHRWPVALWKADDVYYQIVIGLLGYIRLPLLLYPTEVPTWLFCESSALSPLAFTVFYYGWRQIDAKLRQLFSPLAWNFERQDSLTFVHFRINLILQDYLRGNCMKVR